MAKIWNYFLPKKNKPHFFVIYCFQFIQDLIKMQETYIDQILQKKFVDLLFSHPFIKIKVVEDHTIAKRKTATEYLKKLEVDGLLL